MKKIPKYLKQIIKDNKIKVRWWNNRYSAAYSSSKIIILSKHYNNYQLFISTIFHEIAHIKCYNEGLFIRYHISDKRKHLDYLRRYGLRAEMYVDKVANKLMKEHSNMRFLGQYKQKYAREWYKNVWLKKEVK